MAFIGWKTHLVGTAWFLVAGKASAWPVVSLSILAISALDLTTIAVVLAVAWTPLLVWPAEVTTAWESLWTAVLWAIPVSIGVSTVVGITCKQKKTKQLISIRVGATQDACELAQNCSPFTPSPFSLRRGPPRKPRPKRRPRKRRSCGFLSPSSAPSPNEFREEQTFRYNLINSSRPFAHSLTHALIVRKVQCLPSPSPPVSPSLRGVRRRGRYIRPRLLSGANWLPWTGSPSGPVTLAASFPLSPNTTSKQTTSLSPTDRTAFFGLLFTIAVWWTNTSSFVSWRLMKPYPLFTLNHLTVPVTFSAKIRKDNAIVSHGLVVSSS